MEAVTLEPCTLSDLKLLQKVSLETFREAFADQNDPVDFESYLQQAFNMDRLKRDIENPLIRFFFLYNGEKLAGYIKINSGSAQTELQDPHALEIERIYVRKLFQGMGLGSQLLKSIKSLGRA